VRAVPPLRGVVDSNPCFFCFFFFFEKKIQSVRFVLRDSSLISVPLVSSVQFSLETETHTHHSFSLVFF
jgi:hypothetical protein